MSERLLRAEVEDHLERSQRALAELVNANYEVGGPIAGDRARAADLVASGRLYRRSAEQIGESEIGRLLEDIERVLVEVANGPADLSPGELTRLRLRIDEQDLVFRVRVVARDQGNGLVAADVRRATGASEVRMLKACIRWCDVRRDLR